MEHRFVPVGLFQAHRPGAPAPPCGRKPRRNGQLRLPLRAAGRGAEGRARERASEARVRAPQGAVHSPSRLTLGAGISASPNASITSANFLRLRNADPPVPGARAELHGAGRDLAVDAGRRQHRPAAAERQPRGADLARPAIVVGQAPPAAGRCGRAPGGARDRRGRRRSGLPRPASRRAGRPARPCASSTMSRAMLASWKAMPRSLARSSVSRSAGIDAHDMRHHHADRARHLVAVGQQILLGRRGASRRRRARSRRDGRAAGRRESRFRRRPSPKRVERHQAGRLARQRGVGLSREEGDAARRDRRARSASWPSVWPSVMSSQARHQAVEQPAPLARLQVENLAGEAEALRSLGDASPRRLDQPLRASSLMPASAPRSPRRFRPRRECPRRDACRRRRNRGCGSRRRGCGCGTRPTATAPAPG